MVRSDPQPVESHLVSLSRRPRLGSTRRRAAFAVALVVLATAIAAWALTDGAAVDDRFLVVADDGAISLLDPETGDVLFDLPGAVATPDRSSLLTTSTIGDHTILESRDPSTGTVTGSTTLDGELSVRTVSPQGQAVALMPGPRGAGLLEPEPRERTSLTVSYLDDRAPRAYDLDGNFEPEMFTYDEGGLFVLEFDPPTDPTSYYVRRLDLSDGTLSDTGAPQVGLNPKMRGKARAQVLHPDGTWLYTLYTLPQDGEPVFDVDDDSPRYAFIHVINLEEEWSHCIFLPTPIGTVDEASVGMGISPDGTEIIVADPSTSTLARVDTTELTGDRTHRVERLQDNGTKATVAIADDGTAYLGSGPLLLELDLATMQPTRAWSQAEPISALSLSAAGDELRVGGGGVITLIDRATHEEKAVLQAPGRGTVTLLGPPRGSVTEFPLECAC